MRSPAVARELEIAWNEVEWPSSYDEKYGYTALPLSSLNRHSDQKHRPTLVYIYRVNDPKSDETEQKIFGTMDIILASRFFRCYRMSDADLPTEKIKEKYLLKKGPTLILLDARGNEVVRNTKKATAKWLFGRMKKQFKADFGESLIKHIKALNEWLDDLERAEDRLADAARVLQAAQDRIEKRETPAARKRLAKATKAHQKLEAEYEKVLARGEKITSIKAKRPATARR